MRLTLVTLFLTLYIFSMNSSNRTQGLFNNPISNDRPTGLPSSPDPDPTMQIDVTEGTRNDTGLPSRPDPDPTMQINVTEGTSTETPTVVNNHCSWGRYRNQVASTMIAAILQDKFVIEIDMQTVEAMSWVKGLSVFEFCKEECINSFNQRGCGGFELAQPKGCTFFHPEILVVMQPLTLYEHVMQSDYYACLDPNEYPACTNQQFCRDKYGYECEPNTYNCYEGTKLWRKNCCLFFGNKQCFV